MLNTKFGMYLIKFIFMKFQFCILTYITYIITVIYQFLNLWSINFIKIIAICVIIGNFAEFLSVFLGILPMDKLMKYRTQFTVRTCKALTAFAFLAPLFEIAPSSTELNSISAIFV